MAGHHDRGGLGACRGNRRATEDDQEDIHLDGTNATLPSSPFRIMGARNRRDPYDDNQQRQNGPNVAPSLTSKPAQTDTYVWTNRQPDAIGLPTRAV